MLLFVVLKLSKLAAINYVILVATGAAAVAILLRPA